MKVTELPAQITVKLDEIDTAGTTAAAQDSFSLARNASKYPGPASTVFWNPATAILVVELVAPVMKMLLELSLAHKAKHSQKEM